MKNFVAYVRAVLRKQPFRVFMAVLAEEPTPPTSDPNLQGGDPTPTPTKTQTPEPTPSGTVNFEDLIGKARKEERDKLYPEINKLKDDKNKYLLVIGEKDDEIKSLKDEIATLKGDLGNVNTKLKDSKTNNKALTDLQIQYDSLQKEYDTLQTQYENEVNSLKLQSYKEKKIAEASGEIIAELVNGNTEEEINASYELAKTKYTEITNRALQNVQMPSVNPASSQISLTQDVSLTDIKQMNPKQYAEYRKNLGL